MIPLTNSFIWGSFVIAFGVMFIFFPPVIASSCGGKDVCGNKWCPIGFIEQYETIMFIVGIILILVGIASVIAGQMGLI